MAGRGLSGIYPLWELWEKLIPFDENYQPKPAYESLREVLIED